MSLQGEGGKAPDTQPANYLPFAELELKGEEDPLLEPATKEILIYLLRSLQLPPHVYKVLANPPSTKKGDP
jgi:hypothetical protein